jgi:hypothetical protein
MLFSSGRGANALRTSERFRKWLRDVRGGQIMRTRRVALSAGIAAVVLHAVAGADKPTATATDLDHPPRTGAIAGGAASSPIAPPVENDHVFVVNQAPGELDTECTFRSGGPLEFNIAVTR